MPDRIDLTKPSVHDVDCDFRLWSIDGTRTDQCPPCNCHDKTVETVNHPSHYNVHPSGIECIEIVEHFNFNVGNAIKYLWRAGLKGGSLERWEDLKKAAWYVNREIDRQANG